MTPPKSISTRHRHDLDNLRSFLISLAVTHHTAVAYGGSGAMPPYSVCFDKTSPILTPFLAINQSFAMGLFFWISGQMTAKSLSRSMGWEFVRSKLWRLGVPTLLYSAFLDPLRAIALRPRGDLRSNVKAYFKAVLNFRGAQGPVWYTATLLIFDLCAVLLKRCFHLWSIGLMRSSEFSILAKSYALLSRWGWLGVAGGSFLVSTRFPPGKPLPVIHVQPSYLLQYIYAYSLGHMAFYLGKPRMTGLFDKESQPRLSLGKALAISLGTLPILLLPGLLSTKKSQSIKKTPLPTGGEKDLELGGWNSTAALYATWNELSFNTVGPAVMSVFERNYNQPAKWKLLSTRYSFAAFLLHPPISWAAGMGVDALLCPQGKIPPWMASRTWTDFGPVLMTGAVSMIDIVASFGVGLLLVDYVPGVDTLL